MLRKFFLSSWPVFAGDSARSGGRCGAAGSGVRAAFERMFDRHAHELSAGARSHLVEQLLQGSFDGIESDPHLIGNFLVRASFEKTPEYQLFPSVGSY